MIRKWILFAAAFALVIATSALGREPGSGPLSEEEIKSVMESALPRATFRYDRIAYSGDGVVVAGKATKGSEYTFFKVVSGKPDYKGRHLPKSIFAPPGVVEGDLVIRVAQDRRGPGSDPSLAMSLAIGDALCEFRIGGDCGD